MIIINGFGGCVNYKIQFIQVSARLAVGSKTYIL